MIIVISLIRKYIDFIDSTKYVFHFISGALWWAPDCKLSDGFMNVLMQMFWVQLVIALAVYFIGNAL